MSPRATRILLVAVGLVVVALVGWFAFSQPGNDVRGKDVGFSVLGPEAVTITFDVAKPKDATVVCELEALNSSYAQVGTRTVTIGPSDIAEARFTVEIATSEEAVTAVVKSCRTAE